VRSALPALVSALALVLAAGSAPAQTSSSFSPVLMPPDAARTLAADWRRYPLFAAEVERARKSVAESIRGGINVPIPKDGGGGPTHEQHKRNYRAIYDAGLLFRITGERRYADHARDLLLAYAKLYPTLGRHPAGRGEIPGRLFWQTLNDSVWLVHGIQGYDAIRETLTPEQRRTIDDQVFRRMASFLSEENPRNFNLIHNHATWALAGVGMTGYVLRDRDLVEKALLGLDKSGKSGFLRQLELLFSPDGYYEEGPYYQRYALMPFVVFAKAINTNEPQRRIFEHRDGILPKAIRATIHQTYGGYFFPINDALKDKGLWTEELYHGVAIGYGRTQDPSLLSVAQLQNRTVLSAEGLQVARALAEGKAQPFPFRSIQFSDGPDGKRGALAVLRSGSEPGHQAVVMKNTAQGMGHGHFDKLSWIFYDNGQEVVTDYGAARFLNVESKGGGGYLPENKTWAKQTVAHNALVVNEESHFGFDLEKAEAAWPTPLHFSDDGRTRIASARMDGAYPGVKMHRTLAMLEHPELGLPVVVDLLRVNGPAAAQYDLPLHYRGHITNMGFKLKSNVEARPVLGRANGYQHVWVDGTATPTVDQAHATWILGNRFYTYRFLPAEGAELIAAETGANDPQFNLRRDPLFIQRVKDARDATFVSVLEPHGEYNASAEYTLASRSRIARLTRTPGSDADVITVETTGGKRIVLALAHDPDPKKRHRVTVDGRPLEWTGFHARFDR
jgi:hypothetical protein